MKTEALRNYVQGAIGSLIVAIIVAIGLALWSHYWVDQWQSAELYRLKTQVAQEQQVQAEGVKWINSVIQSLPTTPKGGQSKTPTLLVVDESAWNQYFREIYTATEPGIEAAKGRVIVVSNAIKTAPGWPFTRELMTNALKGANVFKPVFLPWTAHPGRPTDPVMDTDTNLPIPRFIWSQKFEKNKADEDIIEHYPATIDEAISTLGGSYFGTTLKRHDRACRGAVGSLVRNQDKEIEFAPDARGPLEVWRFPYHLVQGWDQTHWARRYCVGSDVSEGLGQSYSVGYVMDRHLDEMVCRLRSNRVDAYSWAEMLALLAEWYSSAREWTRTGGVSRETSTICAENTGAGQTTVRRLKELGANQYLKMIEGQMGGGHTTVYGWSESQQAKQDLSEDLRTWFRNMKGTLYDAVLIDEASTWIKHEGSMKLGPEEGHYGDCVIAAGCTIQASHFVGRGPERIKAPEVGWMARQIEEKGTRTGWTV